MGRPRELTGRDKELLSLLARCRVLEMNQVARVYGVRDYHRMRVEVLAARGYLLRQRGLVKATQKGLREMGLNGDIVPVRNAGQRRKLAGFAEVYLALRDRWSFAFSGEYKKRRPDLSFASFGAVIARNGAEYVVYLLLSKSHESSVAKLRQEIAGLVHYNIRRAVVLCAHDHTLALFGSDPLGLDSLILLPYPGGLDILCRLDEIHACARAEFPGCLPCKRPFADYERDDVYISVLADHDLARQRFLHDYLGHVQRFEKRPCVGVCLPGQEEHFAAGFPGLQLTVLPWEADREKVNAK